MAHTPRNPLRSLFHRLIAVACGAALLVAAVFVAPAQAAALTATFGKSSEWNGGYVGEFLIENGTSETVDSWVLEFGLSGDTGIDNTWNAGNVTVSGDRYIVEGPSWASLPPGGTVDFGFVAEGSGEPYDCTINGQPCAGNGADTGNGDDGGDDGGGDGGAPPAGSTPVDAYGQIQVCGADLCDENGNPIQLTGMSSHGLQWFDHCLTDSSLDALAYEWGSDVFRIAMYVQEGGYEEDPRWFTDRVHELIEEATDRGMYVVVDWHTLDPGDPNYNIDAAKEFFAEIAAVHADKDNVIYEIANEPHGVEWEEIRSYAEEVIPVIRAEDPDSVVLVGTRAWASLGVSEGSDHQEIVDDPVDADNVMYTFHFYAASHGDDYLNTLAEASQVLPIFVSEFGTQEYTGDGGNDFEMSQAYIDLMAQEQISWANWNYSDDFRSGAVFNEGVCAAGGPWTDDSSLKPAGQWIRDRIQEAALN